MEFIALIIILFVWGPTMAQTPNSACYLVKADMSQARPCTVEETR